MPKIVNEQEWQAALNAFRVKEKEQMQRQDALNAERRLLPMVRIEKPYEFNGPDGKVSLLDLFNGRKQLIVYHFMYAPDANPCVGCSMMVDNMGHNAHLEARETSRVLVSRAPYPKLVEFKQRMGWKIPWYSSYESDFNFDFGLSSDDGEMFGVSVFLREGDQIYRTYFTWKRGAEYLGSNFTYLDLTPWGRQELWEKSPKDVPQGATYQWWCYHDSYEE